MRTGLVDEFGSGSLGAVWTAAKVAAMSDTAGCGLDGLRTGGVSSFGGAGGVCAFPGVKVRRTVRRLALVQNASGGAAGKGGGGSVTKSGCSITGARFDMYGVVGNSNCLGSDARGGGPDGAAAWICSECRAGAGLSALLFAFGRGSVAGR